MPFILQSLAVLRGTGGGRGVREAEAGCWGMIDERKGGEQFFLERPS